ncbi:DUF397 domain-containing protein [Streptomyces sp. UNOC14_S4]|uniref:DUF397 domain-containing protein n=1 Tax=Streptomyces sp. UNOC14_S4 TaxID=2872340 RepID=UPI001E54B96E|nr:DUF397 domain-containing protein [Streptomyces sp. UNOC14_S4]MCC3767200.1 DUF397 domain-containing protein [Streptomyces sp. UNOC14_S4]
MSALISWQKSSFSESEGSCVELAWHEGIIVMREGNDPGVTIRLTPARLGALIVDVKSGALIA